MEYQYNNNNNNNNNKQLPLKVRPKKICVFPITSVKKIGSVGREMFLF